jgi:hypothetical protein
MDHHITRSLVDSAVFRWTRSLTTMYSCSSLTACNPCARFRISFSMGAMFSSSATYITPWTLKLHKVRISIIESVVHTPNNLVRDGAHNIREAVFIAAVLLRGDRHSACRLLILFVERIIGWVCQLYERPSAATSEQTRIRNLPKNRYPCVHHRRPDTL